MDSSICSVRPCLPEQPRGLRPDAVQGEEAVEIRRQVRDGAVTGVEERTSRGPADPDTVEDGAAIPGVDHAPRIGTSPTDWLRNARDLSSRWRGGQQADDGVDEVLGGGLPFVRDEVVAC
jgi:hypothetical protein